MACAFLCPAAGPSLVLPLQQCRQWGLPLQGQPSCLMQQQRQQPLGPAPTARQPQGEPLGSVLEEAQAQQQQEEEGEEEATA